MKEITCIVCPKGCRLEVDENNGFKVTGNGCKRGITYGISELKHPTRMITSTVRLRGASLRRCPVKLSQPIAKELILPAMATLNNVVLDAPVKAGQLVVANVCDSGVDFIASRAFDKADD